MGERERGDVHTTRKPPCTETGVGSDGRVRVNDRNVGDTRAMDARAGCAEVDVLVYAWCCMRGAVCAAYVDEINSPLWSRGMPIKARQDGFRSGAQLRI